MAPSTTLTPGGCLKIRQQRFVQFASLPVVQAGVSASVG
jgi:hypothetical protein